MNSKNKIDIEKLLKTTSDLVKIESINPPGLEEAVGKYLLEFFKNENIETQIFEVEKNRFNVVAKIKGKSSNSPLAFTGHMDVVPVSKKEFSKWKTSPFSGEVKDGFIFGRGSSDMKGGLASAMCAMREIVKQKIIPSQDIYLIATVDEEDNMRGSKALLNEIFIEQISLVIVCEPTNLKICTAGKGRTYGKIKIEGETGHGSQGKGKNVIDFARQLLNKMDETSFSEFENTPYGNSFWQILSINAGVEPCVVPDELELKVDARLVPNHKTDDIWHRIEKIINQLKIENPNYDAKIEIIDKREAWILPESTQIISNLKKIYKNHEIPFETTYFAGTTDGSIFRKKGIDCIILGPGDLSSVHKENEKVSIQELIDSCNIYFELMQQS